ncbi:DNA replication protein psf2 [Actinomortierella wolfii]|nr:DNA replication protein psf2 [Actinomortierella wolfii]KAG0241328.1 DNA replication protein psf2 [Actinomortierella wolfii]
MALPRHLKNGLTPLEIEFLAENELIEISAATTTQTLELIGGRLPGLRPLQTNKVPLWLAITLKKKQKCNIVSPQWMTVESLQKFLKDEQENARFSRVPYHYMEIARILLENACDDIPQPDAVRTLLKDIREARQSKARKGVAALDMSYIQMDDIGLMEINEIRPFFTKAFAELHRLNPSDNAEPDLMDDLGYGLGRGDDTYNALPESKRFNAGRS